MYIFRVTICTLYMFMQKGMLVSCLQALTLVGCHPPCPLTPRPMHPTSPSCRRPIPLSVLCLCAKRDQCLPVCSAYLKRQLKRRRPV